MHAHVRRLNFAYGADSLFNEFDFSTSSQLTVLLGSSGSGKTTLLKLLAGHLEPSSGEVVVPRDDVFLVLQEDALFPWLTGWSNLTTLLPISRAEISQHSLFPWVSSFIDRRAHEMSFGQRRIIELLRALVAKPRLLLLDEPFNFLDPDLRDAVASCLVSSLPPDSECILSTHHGAELRNFPCSLYQFPKQRPIHQLEASA